MPTRSRVSRVWVSCNKTWRWPLTTVPRPLPRRTFHMTDRLEVTFRSNRSFGKHLWQFDKIVQRRTPQLGITIFTVRYCSNNFSYQWSVKGISSERIVPIFIKWSEQNHSNRSRQTRSWRAWILISFVSLFVNFWLSRKRDENHKYPQDYSRHVKVITQCLLNFVLLLDVVEFRYHSCWQEDILVVPIYMFHNDGELPSQIFRRESLHVTQYVLSVDPQIYVVIFRDNSFFIPSSSLSIIVFVKGNTDFGTFSVFGCITSLRYKLSATHFCQISVRTTLVFSWLCDRRYELETSRTIWVIFLMKILARKHDSL